MNDLEQPNRKTVPSFGLFGQRLNWISSEHTLGTWLLQLVITKDCFLATEQIADFRTGSETTIGQVKNGQKRIILKWKMQWFCRSIACAWMAECSFSRSDLLWSTNEQQMIWKTTDVSVERNSVIVVVVIVIIWTENGPDIGTNIPFVYSLSLFKI